MRTINIKLTHDQAATVTATLAACSMTMRIAIFREGTRVEPTPEGTKRADEMEVVRKIIAAQVKAQS